MTTALSLISKITHFSKDAVGLEKTLRLLQAISQIVAAVYTADAVSWLHARQQFLLGRRYLRFFRFIDAFALASDRFSDSAGFMTLLEVGKWSCMGMFLLLESSTIIDAMGIRKTSWGDAALIEGNKFWFYALLFSLALSVTHLFSALTSAPGSGKKNSTNTLLRKIATDAADLLVPGAVTGWLRTGPVSVGVATVVSTVLSSGEVWERLAVERGVDGREEGKKEGKKGGKGG